MVPCAKGITVIGAEEEGGGSRLCNRRRFGLWDDDVGGVSESEPEKSSLPNDITTGWLSVFCSTVSTRVETW